MNGRDILSEVSWKGQGLMDSKSLNDNDFVFDDNLSVDKLLEYIKKNKDKVKESQKAIAKMFDVLDEDEK